MNDLTQTPEMLIAQMGARARRAAALLAPAGDAQKVDALRRAAQALRDQAPAILAANARDMDNGIDNGLSAAMLDRLRLDEDRIAAMAAGVDQVATLDNPLGSVIDSSVRPNGLELSRVRVPLGVIGIIYESRPNVTADAASLCIKSGNACILRGGSEAIESNKAIAVCIARGLQKAGLPDAVVHLVDTTDRAAVGSLLKLNEYVDVIVPRGGEGLIERVSRESTIPVIKHLDGICHVYIDDAADLDMAVSIAVNSKTEKYAVCNALETLLVAESVADAVLPVLHERYSQAGVVLKGCEKTRKRLADAEVATEADWSAEYLGPTLAIRVVEGLDEAIAHINQYGSQHTDAIVTGSIEAADRFVQQVDTANVFVNCSTRFSDGGEYGLGAEIGISTDKLHARGPMGAADLTTYKWVVRGDGQLR